jgi:uncharacterized protein involved in exopolysaccharide biosynthesis
MSGEFPIGPLLRSLRRILPRPLLGVLAVAVVSYGIALLLPKWYTAKTTILPPDEGGDSFGVIANLVEASALSKVGLLSSNSTSDLFVEILDSRRVREPIIAKHDLQRRYGEKNLDQCLKEFGNHVKTDVLKSKVIVLEFEDKDPKMAAMLANDMVDGLDRVWREARLQKAERASEFVTGQLEDARNRLHVAEERLTAYEKRYGFVGGSENAAVQGAADIVARKLALQVRRTWMESYSGRDNPALQALNSELSALDREIGRLPGIKQEATRLNLDVEIQRRVYTLLNAQLEEARLEGSRTISTVSVLDSARAPTLRSRPRRMVIVAVTAGIAFLGVLAWALRKARRELEAAGYLTA